MEDSVKDLIIEKIKKHYSENGNYDFEKIKILLEKESKIFTDDEVLRKRIEPIKNENFEFYK
jgi:hypothetical protein